MPEKNKQRISVDISFKTILKFFAVFLLLYFLYVIREVAIILLVSVIIVAAMSPLVERLKKIKVPRSVTVLGIYIILFAFIGTLISLIIPQVALQIKDISRDVPQFINRTNEVFGQIPQHENIASGIQTGLKNLSEDLAGSTTNIFFTIFKIFGGIVTFFAVLVLSFYISVAEGDLMIFIRSIIPEVYSDKFQKIEEQIRKKIGAWVRGEAILMMTIGTLTFIGLKILGIQYALTLAVIAGLLEIVPVIGPIISAVPAVIVGFAQAPILGLAVIILYIIVQQAENHILVPKVMEKTTGLSPIVIVLALLVGAKLLGFIGVLLAVPVALILSVFIDELISKTIEKHNTKAS